jgi:ABC-type multidrug transport system fused ATPase/permease subunit
VNQAISNAVPALVLVVTLTAYVKTGKPIVASTIFTAISLFNQLRFPLFFYPMLIDSLANGKNALRRVSSYLSSEEVTPYVEMLPPLEGGGGSIDIHNGNFLWSTAKVGKDGEVETLATPALCGVDLKINPGEVVAVVGPVGSGKSALIKGLLGELAPVPRTVVDQSLNIPNNRTESSAAPGIFEHPSVVTHGNIGYCSQEAWLPKGSIREAVVFGREYDEQRYLNALRDAGLDADIVDSIDGSNSKAAASQGVLSHDTDVGEGGSSLSGGQRARVALARALYAGDDTKVFLLDDPLAALDASVGSTVFERLTRRLRSSNAATVLVTNDPSIPRRCDRVILMGKYSPSSSSCSTVIDVGTYDELLARGHDIREALTSHKNDDDGPGGSEDRVVDGSSIDIAVSRKKRKDTIRVVGGYEVPLNDTESYYQCDLYDPEPPLACMETPDYIADRVVPVTRDNREMHAVIEELSVEPSLEISQDACSKEKVLKAPPVKKLTSVDDTMAKGAVPLSAYVSYFKSVNKPILVAAMILSYLMANGAQFFQQYVVAKWTEVGSGDAIAVALGAKYLRSLVNAAGVVSIFLWLRSFLTMKMGVRASKSLHNRMLTSVFAAPMSFFDATPSGQLLSRFGKEMEVVDRALPDSIGSVLFCFLQIFLSFSALAGVITPGMLVPLFFIGIQYAKTMGRFRPAARDLKGAESKTRSPIYTHFGEAIRGTEIIRSVPRADGLWSAQHRGLTDRNLSVLSSVKALDRWLSIRLETLGNVVVFISAIASVYLTRLGKLNAGSAGWGLTQALAVTGLLTWAVRTLTDLESNMMSVMRVKELTDLDADKIKGILFGDEAKANSLMPREPAATGEALVKLQKGGKLSVPVTPPNEKALLASGWPWKGNIVFNNASMRYNEVSPLVLKNVTIGVPPGTTLGVVGRTGSGKSSLLLTLFRLVELEVGGSIEIDGVDIRSISLQGLRESLSIIPQEPVLFAGTVMYNLDATGKAKPEDAWAALQAGSPELAQQFRNAGTGLDTYISEGGKNLSLGQRQLICLARALLRKSRILVMDEATSSVDPKTDAQVQDTIRREFVNKGVTVITVAHRLDTVLGYDKIAVLGSGELLEYGSPNELLRKRDGELKRLVNADRLNKKKGAKADQEKLVAVG